MLSLYTHRNSSHSHHPLIVQPSHLDHHTSHRTLIIHPSFFITLEPYSRYTPHASSRSHHSLIIQPSRFVTLPSLSHHTAISLHHTPITLSSYSHHASSHSHHRSPRCQPLIWFIATPEQLTQQIHSFRFWMIILPNLALQFASNSRQTIMNTTVRRPFKLTNINIYYCEIVVIIFILKLICGVDELFIHFSVRLFSLKSV